MKAAPAFLPLFVFSLFFPFAGAWFSEYSYRLPVEYPSTWYMLLMPQKCSGFEDTQLVFPKGIEEKAFSKALAEALEAKKALERASFAAEWQKNFFGGPAGQVFHNWLSVECFAHGAEALRRAAAGAVEGLTGVDSVLKELDEMVGDAPGTSGAAVVLEARAEAKAVEEKTSGEKGVGPRLVRAAGVVEGIWNGFRKGSVDSWGLVEGVRELVGEDGLVAEEIVFARKARKAMQELRDEYDGLREEWAMKGLGVKTEWEQLEADRLWVVGETSLFFDEWSEVLGEEFGVGSFRESIGKIKKLREEAEKLFDLAGGKMQARKRGYFSETVRLLREAVGKLGDAGMEMNSLEARSRALEEKAKQKMLEAFAEAEGAAEAARLSNPRASAKAMESLEREEKRIRAMNSAALGDRINFFVKEIRVLEDIAVEAKGIESVEEERARAVEKIDAVKKMLEAAGGDGIEVEYERDRLKAVEYSVLRAGSGEESAEVFSVLEDKLAEISEGVLAAALEKYGALLDGYWERVKKIQSLLAPEERLRVEGVEKFFPAGALDVRTALGSLAETRRVLEGILSRVEANAPTLLKKHLEDGMIFSESIGLARPGEKTEVVVDFRTKNELPIGYSGEIALSAPVLPPDFIVLEKSSGVKVSGGTVYLTGAEEGTDYWFKGKYYEKIAEVDKETESTVSASEGEAVKMLEIVFSSTREAKTVVERFFDFPARFSVSSDRVFSWSWEASAQESRVVVVVDAEKGSNRVVISYSVDEPIEVMEEVVAGQGNNSISFRLSFLNKYVDLDNVVLHYANELACAEKIDLRGLDGKAGYQNGFLTAEFRVPWFQKRETKAAEIVVSCSSLEAAAAQKLASIESIVAALNASPQFPVLLGELEKARRAFEERNYAAALAVLSGLEEKIIDAAEETESRAGEEAENLRLAGEELFEKNMVPDAARAVIALADEALGFAGEGREEAAWKKVSEAKKVFVKKAEELVAEIKKLGGEITELEALAALGKWIEFFEKARAELAAADEREKESQKALEEKKALLSDYERQRSDADKSMEAFSTAFWVPDDDAGAGGARKKSLLFKEGERLVEKMDKALKKLDSAWTAGQSDALERFSTEFIQANMNDLEAAKKGVEEIIAQMRDRAEDEILAAGERQKQFGSQDTLKTLEEAEQAFGENKFFYSHFLASLVEKKLSPMTGETTAGGAEGLYWFLGAFGLAALGGLAYFFSTRKEKELKEL